MAELPSNETLASQLEAQRLYFESRLAEKDLRDEQRFVQQQVSIDRAAESVSKRLDTMNEFRQALNDQARGFMPRPEYEAKHQALADRVSKNEERAQTLLSRAEANVQHTAVNGRIDTLDSRYDQRITAVERAQTEELAARSGARLTVSRIYAGLAALATLLAVVFLLIDHF